VSRSPTVARSNIPTSLRERVFFLSSVIRHPSSVIRHPSSVTSSSTNKPDSFVLESIR
jgi:hypothetical protein